jgi:protein TonB
MNFALSQRGADRHPIGLLVVVGLHVLLAAVLVSARIAGAPTVPPPYVLKPLDPTPPVERKPLPLPTPPLVQPRTFQAPLPPIPLDRTDDTPTAQKVDDKAAPQPPVVVASVGDNTVHDPMHVQPHRAIINAGAAQCRPDYPAAAQRAGVTGVSRIRFSIDAAGRVLGAQILQASGPTRENRLLDKAAAEALAQCPVTAGTDEMGRPVGATADVEYVWKLN